MTTITVVPADGRTPPSGFLATAGDKQASGPTAGQAIDALTAQLPADGAAVVVIQPMRGDEFFSDAQIRRLTDLMARWRAARDAGGRLPQSEQAELDALIAVELEAATARTAAALRRAAP